MNPFDHAEAYAGCVIGGAKSPGQVKLSGFERAVDWDVKKGGGEDGASTVRQGKPPAKGTLTFELAKDPVLGIDEFEEWDAFEPTLSSTYDKAAPQALDIYHPDLARLQITAIVVESIGQMVHDGKGGATVAVKVLEYRPPKKKAVGRSKGSKGGFDPVKTAIDLFAKQTIDPNAAAKAELDKLLAQADEAA